MMSATNLLNRTRGGCLQRHVALWVNIAVIFILCVFICTPWPAAAESVSTAKTKEQLQAIYMDALKAEGYAPEIKGGRDIGFKKEGQIYGVGVNDEGPPFFVEIYRAFAFEVGGDEDLRKTYDKMTEVTTRTKAVKVYLIDDKKGLVFGAQFYLKNPEDFRDLFPIYLSAIDFSIGKFMAKEKP